MKTLIRSAITELIINSSGVRALCISHGWFSTAARRIQDVACPQCPAPTKRIGRPPIGPEAVVVARVAEGLLAARTALSVDVWQHNMTQELRQRVVVECSRVFQVRGVARSVVEALRAAYGGDTLPLDALDVARALLEATPDLPPVKRPVGRPRGRPVGSKNKPHVSRDDLDQPDWLRR